MRLPRSLVTLLILSSLSFAQMTHEEQLVRNAYAKLSYAVDLNNAVQAQSANPKITADEVKRQVESKSLRFQLADFKVGNLAEVAKTPYANLAGEMPAADSEIIQTSLSTIRHTQKDQADEVILTAVARWSQMPSVAPDNSTVEQQMSEIEKGFRLASRLTRFAAFSVTVTFDGRSLTYPALFLFSASGEIVTEDMVVALGSGPLKYFASHPMFPTATTRFPKGALRDLLESTQRTDTACTPGDACCDLAALRCGITAADLQGRAQ